MVIKRINAVSCAKVMGLLYAILGFLFGGCMALVSLAGGFASSKAAGPLAAFGLGAVILFPLIYGALGFIMTWIAAAIYNVLAGVVGGVQVEVGPSPGSSWNAVEPAR